MELLRSNEHDAQNSDDQNGSKANAASARRKCVDRDLTEFTTAAMLAAGAIPLLVELLSGSCEEGREQAAGKFRV